MIALLNVDSYVIRLDCSTRGNSTRRPNGL